MKMGSDFTGLLAILNVRMKEAIQLLERFLREGKVTHLWAASHALISAGNETYPEFAEFDHAILAAVSLEAGIRLREKALEIEKRGLSRADVEYVTDVRDLLVRLSASIDSGEYENGYREMASRRRGGRREPPRHGA